MKRSMARRQLGALLVAGLVVLSMMAFAACGGNRSVAEHVTAATATPAEDTASEVARPSNPGGPGDAVNLTGDAQTGQKLFSQYCSACHGTDGVGGVDNPGSDDGTVPSLNPIDPTIANADAKTFAYNVDLFVQHGSTAEGDNPQKSMPAWGDKNTLTQQQIADVIAYVISLNQS